MLVGVPKEIKSHEHRVGLTPGGVGEFTARGHKVLVETGAGAGIGVSDAEYRAMGAAIAPDAASVFAKAAMVIKVKEPQPREVAMLHPGQMLFTYLHLAADLKLSRGLLKSGV